MHVLTETKHLLIKERDGWDFVERKKGKSAVAVVAVTEDGKVILTEQFRKPVSASVIDWPAGLVGDEDEKIGEAETAKKELEEETGFVCESVERLAEGPTSPGITSERVALYRAHGVKRVGEGGGVGGESITVHTIARGELEEWLRKKEHDGVLIDLKVWAGLCFLTT